MIKISQLDNIDEVSVKSGDSDEVDLYDNQDLKRKNLEILRQVAQVVTFCDVCLCDISCNKVTIFIMTCITQDDVYNL